MTFFKWSRTSASNNTADSTINYSEGQAPSTVNDSGRAVMAAAAKYRDDIAGANTTAGSSSAYTLSTYQGFDTLAHLNGNMVAFTMHETNVAGATLSVDGMTAKPLRISPGVEVPAGVLIAGTPYAATYYNTAGEFILSGFYGNPYNLPIAGSITYFGSSAPNSSFVLPYGQPLNRTTYADLYNRIGTAYGAGDGSTTFNVPDARGRLIAFWDSMGGTPAGRLSFGSSGIDGTTIGATGGAQTRTLAIGNLPSHNHTGSVSVSSSGSAFGTAAGTASGTASGNAVGSGSLTASTSGVFARGSGTLSGSGTTGGMNRNNPHDHAVAGGTTASTGAGSGLDSGGFPIQIVNAAIDIVPTDIDHEHGVTVSVPYNLAFALDAMSVPYSLSLPFSTSVSASFSVGVSSSVTTTGSGSFTTNLTGSGTAFSTAQPTLVANMILRVI